MIGACCSCSIRKASCPRSLARHRYVTSRPRPTRRARHARELGRRVEPVGRERQQQKPRARSTEGRLERTVALREVERVDRPRQAEQRVGVEAAHEAAPLVLEIPHDLEFRLPRPPRGRLHPLSPELPLHAGVGEIRDVAQHPGDGEAGGRPRPRFVPPTPPLRVGRDRASRNLVERDLLRRVAVGRRDGDDRSHASRGRARPRRAPASRPSTLRRRRQASARRGAPAAPAAPSPCPRSSPAGSPARTADPWPGPPTPVRSCRSSRPARSCSPRSSGSCRTPGRDRSGRPTTRPCHPPRASRPRARRPTARGRRAPRSCDHGSARRTAPTPP